MNFLQRVQKSSYKYKL